MKIKIIAELAQGFEGSAVQADLLVRAAAAAGADAAKFQMVFADELATPDYEHYELFRSLELPDDSWAGLSEAARKRGVELQVDVFGERSLALAAQLGVSAVKIHGTDIANEGLLKSLAASSVPAVLLGAGGAFLPEIERALEILNSKEVVVLLGYQGYPTPDDGNQIARVRLLAERWAARIPTVSIGFSDHAQPECLSRITIPAVALGAGASVFEKHLTLGRIMRMEDHEAALNPDQFVEFVALLRKAALAYGDADAEVPDFGMSDSERSYRNTIRRHVVAGRDIQVGTVLGPADLALKRTSKAESLADIQKLYGRRAVRDVPKNAPLSEDDLS